MSENKTDALNDWVYCNPEKRISQLPMPYRIIDEILNDEILQKAYARVFEIQKYDKDPNYDGNLHESSFQGLYDIEGISCISSDIKTNTYQVIIGDKWGNIHLLDLNKRQILLKKKVAQSRIQQIHCVVNQVQDVYLTTFAVIARGDPTIQVFRHSQFDQDIFLHYQIKCNKNVQKLQKTDSINELPYICKLSQEHKFIAIVLYNGDVDVYQLPLLFEEEQQQKPQSILSLIQNFQKQDITTPYHRLKVEKIKKEKNFKQVFEEYLNNLNTNKQSQQEQQVQQIKPGKPDPKKQEVKKEVVQEVELDFININENQVYGEQIQDENEADISPNYNIPLHRIDFYFIQQEMALPNAVKTFNQVNCIDITTGIIAINLQTNIFQHYELQEFDIRNAPLFLINNRILNQENQSKTSKTKQPVQNIVQMPQFNNPLPEFKPQIRQTFKTIYPIQISQINQQGSFLALGLKDGSTLVWDIIYECENGYPDKFQNEVTQLSFVNDHVLLLGSNDNQVTAYNVTTQNMIFKRTNQFRQKQEYPITGIMGSKSGAAFALDSSNTMRFFDAIHGNKILKIVSFDDYKHFSYFNKDQPIYDIQNTQLLIVAEHLNQSNDNNWQKNTCLLQYNIHNNLIQYYPGLANLNRKGINKEMDIDQLKNPSFEYKNFTNDDKKLDLAASPTQTKTNDVDMNQTFQSQHINLQKKTLQPKESNSRLTQQALHPEKYLLSNINYSEQLPLNPVKQTFNQARERNNNKVQRQQRVTNGLAQIGKDLEIQEERIMLENKKKNLMKIKT